MTSGQSHANAQHQRTVKAYFRNNNANPALLILNSFVGCRVQEKQISHEISCRWEINQYQIIESLVEIKLIHECINVILVKTLTHDIMYTKLKKARHEFIHNQDGSIAFS